MIASSAVSHAYAGLSPTRSVSEWTSTGRSASTNASRNGRSHALRGHKIATWRHDSARNFPRPVSLSHAASSRASNVARCSSGKSRSMSQLKSRRITCPSKISGRGLNSTNATCPSWLLRISPNVAFTNSSCAVSNRNVTENFSSSAAPVATSSSCSSRYRARSAGFR